MRLVAASDLDSRPLTWLWPGRMALGKLAILDGDPGLGKSLLALDLCARLSTCRPLPDGSPLSSPASSIIFNAEDAARDTIIPRLRALGADLSRVFILNLDDDPDLLGLPGQTTQLEDALATLDARLVVFDPVVSFLDASVADGSNQSVRRALLPLHLLAEKYRVVMLLIRHLNKRSSARSIYRGTGSIAFMGACRSGWLVGSDPADASRRVLAELKNNLADPQPSLAFSVAKREDGGSDLTWLGPCGLHADEMLAARPVVAAPGARRNARTFLAEFLRDGPRSSRDIWSAALPLGLSQRTLFRARSELRIRVELVQEGTHRTNYWLLPDQRLPHEKEQPNAFDAWLDELRAEYPPSTPLDRE